MPALSARRLEKLREAIRSIAAEAARTRSEEAAGRVLGQPRRVPGSTSPRIYRLDTGHEVITKFPEIPEIRWADYLSQANRHQAEQFVGEYLAVPVVRALGGKAVPFEKATTEAGEISVQPVIRSSGRDIWLSMFPGIGDPKVASSIQNRVPVTESLLEEVGENLVYEMLVGNADRLQALYDTVGRTLRPIDFGFSWSPWKEHFLNPRRFYRTPAGFTLDYERTLSYVPSVTPETKAIARGIEKAVSQLPPELNEELLFRVTSEAMRKATPSTQRLLGIALSPKERQARVEIAYPEGEELARKIAAHYFNVLIHGQQSAETALDLARILSGRTAGNPSWLKEIVERHSHPALLDY